MSLFSLTGASQPVLAAVHSAHSVLTSTPVPYTYDSCAGAPPTTG